MSVPEDPDRAADSAEETAAAPPEKLQTTSEAVRFTPGTVVAGRYRIVAPVGKGGMGEVYRADDLRLGQPVALKFLPAAFASDAGRLERLVDEVRIGRQISHPNVCRLYDIAEAEGLHFLVMEYVDGEDLASLLRRIGRLPADKALEIAHGLCAGLAAAHDGGVIHRDLKPANVMIDGRGHARIADFGLAALADRGPVSGLAGTLAYMAPEQLTGQGASLRSDVFALGLVLFEMFTGRRAFDAKSLEELKALYGQSKPPSLSSSVKDVDLAVERVVLRCLANDPKDRPASARVVLAALPGGDPLEAAVLAGETPSPETVAAAATVGDLRPAVAWAWLLAAFAGLVLVAGVSGRAELFRLVPMAKSPEELAGRAKDVLARLGYRESPADNAYGFNVDFAFLNHFNDYGASPERWAKLHAARPGPFLFFYRQSPSPLVARRWTPSLPWVWPLEDVGRVTRDEPPVKEPGMAEVVLDPQGRLVSFRAVPHRFEARDGPWPDADWPALLADAGLDPAALHPASPRWSAFVDSDKRAAWDGVYPGQPDVRIHIEAAAYRGRPVWFEVQAPWAQLAALSPSWELPSLVIASTISLFIQLVAIPAGAVLVRRNLRLGRGDRRGAFRLAVFSLITLTLGQLFRADHTSAMTAEYGLLTLLLALSLYFAGWAWFMYMAMEPAVRRRWPHTLISWSRLLAGRFRDPLVGRDVLYGGVAGLASLLVFDVVPVVSSAGLPMSSAGLGGIALAGVLSILSAPRHLALFFLRSPYLAVVQSVVLLFLLFLFEALGRRAWLARLVLFMSLLVIMGAGAEEGVPPGRDLFVGAACGAIFVGILLTVVVRLGLLAAAMMWFVFLVLSHTPLTLDWSAWYAGRSFVILFFFATLFATAFYTSLGGKPLFGRALIED